MMKLTYNIKIKIEINFKIIPTCSSRPS